MKSSNRVILSIALATIGMSSGRSLFTAGATSVTPKPPWSNLPVRTSVNPHSGAGDAINVAFEGTRTQILDDFKRAGWLPADPLNFKNDDRLARAALHHGKYPTAPVSRQYLFGRIEDFAVEKELSSVSQRDHARFWDTGRLDPATHLELWVGAASRDIGIKIVRKHRFLFGTTHRIDGHIDAERDLIVTSMKNIGVVASVVVERGIGHVSGMRTGGGDLITTDGNADVIVLK